MTGPLTKPRPHGVSVELLADRPELIQSIGRLRWNEWGRVPEQEDPDWWIDVTAREAGRERVPVTWVAINELGRAVGAVGLGEFDIEEIVDRSPWVMGMIVEQAHRRKGIGTQLIQALEGWARDRDHKSV